MPLLWNKKRCKFPMKKQMFESRGQYLVLLTQTPPISPPRVPFPHFILKPRLRSQETSHSLSRKKQEKKMTNEQKNGLPEMGIQLPEIKVEVAEENFIMSGPTPDRRKIGHRKSDVMHVVLRLLCLLTCVTSVSVMATAKQASTISLYGFSIPVFSKWSFSDSFE